MATAQAAQVRDHRGRVREIFCAINRAEGASFPNARACAKALHRIEAEPQPSGAPVHLGAAQRDIDVVVVPGIFGECVKHISRPFQAASAHLSAHGYRVHILDVDGRSSSKTNAAQIARQLARIARPRGGHMILIGYSKGTSDLIETMTRHPNAIPPGSSIVSVSGVVAGTPIAERGEKLYASLLGKLRLKGCSPGDGGGVTSLTRRERLNWLQRHPLSGAYRYYSLAAMTQRGNVSGALRPFKAMLDRVDARNDGQVIHHDAIFPGGALLGYADADHWAVTLDFDRNAPLWMRPFTNRNGFPREVLLEAIVRAIEEDLLGAGP